MTRSGLSMGRALLRDMLVYNADADAQFDETT